MGVLKVLPAQLANMIAAGEVVQRPSSVVKELMENAVDAQSTKVSVIIADAGRTLIQVIDDGCGMSPSDAVLCFERHATSKIAEAEDLNSILSYGFRGEALASIAAVSEVSLKTRREKDSTGVEVKLGLNGQTRTASVACPKGSNFQVRNLFCNTPARRKFLKSDNVELKHIIEEFTRVALTRPEIAFSLSSNGRDLFQLKPAKSLKFRLLDLLGGNVVGDLVDIETETSLVKIHGYIGRPQAARKTLGNQFFFVNGRYFRSPYLHKAVMTAYEEIIPDGLTPSYFIFLEMDPQSVDINIHPTKTEVKFEDDSLLFQVLMASVRETIGRNSFGASLDFETGPQLPQLGSSFEEYRGPVSMPEHEIDPDYNPFDTTPSGGVEMPRTPVAAPQGSYATRGFVASSQDYGKLFEQEGPSVRRTMIVVGKYIVTPSASGMMLVNIRRARQRILYEQTLRSLSDEVVTTQALLFTSPVQVGVQGALLFEQNAALLERIGFQLSIEGDSVTISGVPQGFSDSCTDPARLVEELSAILSESGKVLPELMKQRMAEKIALAGCSGPERPGSQLEAQQLIDTLFACDNAEFTSDGHKIVSIITLDELDKRF